MKAHRSVVAGLAIIAIAGCSDSVTEPDAFDVDLSASAVDGLDPCVGDLKLTTQAEVDAFNCTSVDGHVWIGPSTDISSVVALSGLVSVGGGLVLDENPLLTNLDGLSSVTSVGDLVFLRDNSVLNIDALSSLVTISGVLIASGTALTDLDGLSSLKSVREIDITGSSFTRIELPALESAWRAYVTHNAVLEELNLPRLPFFDRLTLTGNDALTQLNLPSLVEVGLLEAFNNDALPSLDGLEALATADWMLLDSNAALENVDALSSLSSLNQLRITNNPALTNCADGLGAILASWDPANEQLRIENNAPGCNSPAEIVAEAYPCLGDVTLTTQAEVDAFNCTSVDGQLWIGPSADISNVAALSGLVSVGGDLVLRENALLTNLDGLSSVTSVGGLVFLGNNALLNIDGLSSLVTISGVLIVSGNGLIDLGGLSSLKSVLDIDVGGSSPSRIELPALESVRNFFVQRTTALEELNLPRLAYVDYLLVTHNDALTRLNFPGLVEIGFLEAYFNDALPSLDGLGSLTTAEWIRLDNNPSLENVDALSAVSSLNQLDITNNPALAECARGLGILLVNWDPDNERLQIENNAPGCNSPAEIVADCPKCTGFGPVISVDVPSIDWSFVEGDTNTRMTSVAISNTGAGTLSDLSIAIDAVTSSTGWLDVQLNSSTAPPDATADVTVDPSGLAAGTHIAEFTLSSPDAWNAAEVRVVVNVAPRPSGLPVIRTSVPDISWSILKGDGGRPSRSTSLWITNGGGGTLAGLTALVEYAHAPRDWVHIGMGDLVERGVPMTVDLDALDLPVGSHVAEVTVSSPTATNSVEIRIVVDVRWRPDAPSGLTATNANMDVTLLWTDNSEDEDEFRIERRELPHGEWSEIKEVPANTTSFSNRVTTPDWYSYRARACNAAGCSSYVGVNNPLPVPSPPKLEFRPARSAKVGVSVGGDSDSATVWMVNVGSVPQHWYADRYVSPIGWRARPGAGSIPPGGSMAVVMTAFAPQSWGPGPPLPATFETAMLMRDAITHAWLGGVGLSVTVFR